MTEQTNQPSQEVLDHFDISDLPKPLPGGQGVSWIADRTVLKPAEDEAFNQWMCEIQLNLHESQSEFRVAEPIGRDGRFVFNGWTATRFVSGIEDNDLHVRLAEIMKASRAMHNMLKGIVAQRPAILSTLTHRWAYADRIAWDEPAENIPMNETFYTAEIEPYLLRLNTLKRTVPEASFQLVHGDLAGNLLFEEGQHPAILDFSFYWRPVEYAEAMVLADGMLWQGFTIEEVQSIGWNTLRFQMLVRTLIFRIVTFAIAHVEAFVQANWRKMNAEYAVKLLEDIEI